MLGRLLRTISFFVHLFCLCFAFFTFWRPSTFLSYGFFLSSKPVMTDVIIPILYHFDVDSPTSLFHLLRILLITLGPQGQSFYFKVNQLATLIPHASLIPSYTNISIGPRDFNVNIFEDPFFCLPQSGSFLSSSYASFIVLGFCC